MCYIYSSNEVIVKNIFLNQYPQFIMLSLIFLHKTKMKRQQNHKSAPCHKENGVLVNSGHTAYVFITNVYKTA